MSNAVKSTGKLQVTTPSDREIAMTRVFDAPRRLVYDALTKPELVRRWLRAFGPGTQVFQINADNIVGLVFLKDLVARSAAGEGNEPVRGSLRRATEAGRALAGRRSRVLVP